MASSVLVRTQKPVPSHPSKQAVIDTLLEWRQEFDVNIDNSTEAKAAQTMIDNMIALIEDYEVSFKEVIA